jgi:hypothetical protein
MELQQRELLRLHVEAVWDVKLPPVLAGNEIELLPEGLFPDWKLFAAQLDEEFIAIWRPNVALRNRPGLLLHAQDALMQPTTAIVPGVSREVALQQIVTPHIDASTARHIARPITEHDRELVEGFEAGSSPYYFSTATRPLFGAVVDGRLLSLAHSSRRTGEACELGIATLPEARRKGYALAATILWAMAVAGEGLVPLYSAFVDNFASHRLAHAAGFRIFARAATLQ